MEEQSDALQNSEHKLAAAARLAQLGYWELDVVANRVSWSEESCRVLGLRVTERARSWDDFMELVHVDDRPTLEECRARILRGEQGGRVVFRLPFHDGSIRYAEAMGEAVRDQNGRTIRTVGAIQDVSERKRADEALRGSQERFQLALQATGLGLWDWDFTTNTVQFWLEWKRQLGYEPDEIPNEYEEWETRLHPDDRERVLTALRGYLDGKLPEYALEFRLRHKDGTYLWIYTRGVVLRDSTGRQTHMIGCHLDITERKQLEEQYRQSQKMEAVGQLAGGIAHDFNNLLVVIGGYAELVAEELGPSHPSRRDVDDIRAATRSAATLTRQLLAFGRRQILQPQVLDLNHVLRRMHRMLGRVIGEHITLVMTLSATARVYADPGQIDQVIMNLVLNARDAMPNGGRLMIETADAELDAAYVAQHRGASAGRHVMIAVSDTGVGMDEMTRARVFEPFFTTKAVGHGTGLGLATVYGIVKQSGGSIWVYSEPGRGTTFKIYLPRIKESVAEAVDKRTEPESPRGSETILVVEDDEIVRTLTCQALRRYGYLVVEAANGGEALLACERHPETIPLMITDVVMPHISGPELAARLRRLHPEIHVLYISGYTDDAVVRHGLLDEALSFLQKPFTPSALVHKVRDILDQQTASPAS
jgi:two-component system, cell cycle sensor histidine kinase and response regulator CckA